jgi:carboxypeptidase C (cathepsin A)
MEAFVAKYPEYNNTSEVPRAFYLTGESYCGKYISIFAKSIYDNYQAGGNITLTAILIANPLAAPLI